MEVKRLNNKVIFVATRKYFIFAGITVFLFIFVVSSTFRAQAEIATVLPGLYSVSGINLQNEEQNISPYTQFEYEWNNFSNVIPDGSFASNVFLRISWSLSDSLSEHTLEPELDTQSQEIPVIIIDSLPETDIDLLPSKVGGASSVNEVNEEFDDEDSSGEIIPATEETQPEEEVIESLDMVLDNNSYPLVFAQAEEVIVLETTETFDDYLLEDVTESIEVDGYGMSAATSSGKNTSEVDVANIDKAYDPSEFEVMYSLNGQSWEHLGVGNFYTMEETVFELPNFSAADIANLQIKLIYVAEKDNVTKIYFNTMQLEVEYTATEDINEEVSSLVDQEPNFSISAIKADEKSGNIRVVIIEKGGMYELWYSVTDPSTDVAVWSRLVNDGSIDESATLGVKGRTIFWLDKNQQTLFGFNIDEQSIFGKSLSSSEDKSDSLLFEDENSKQWEAALDSASNSFEFSKSNLTQ